MASVFAAFGLAIRSELELPELPGAAAGAEPDVEVRFGDAGAADSGRRWIGGVFQAAGDDCLYCVDNVARFRVRRGREVVVEPIGGADQPTVRLYLLGGAFAALIQQRGLLPLHASALRLGDRAVALAGASGSGKSSLAAALHDRGHRLLGDDLCAVSASPGGRPTTWPGIPRLKLRPDAAARSRDTTLEPGLDVAHKRHLIVPAAKAPAGLPLRAVYVLERAAARCDPLIEPLGGVAAVRAVLANVYRPSLARAVDGGRAAFRVAAALATEVTISRLRFFPDPAKIGAVAAALEDHASRLEG